MLSASPFKCPPLRSPSSLAISLTIIAAIDWLLWHQNWSINCVFCSPFDVILLKAHYQRQKIKQKSVDNFIDVSSPSPFQKKNVLRHFLKTVILSIESTGSELHHRQTMTIALLSGIERFDSLYRASKWNFLKHSNTASS